VCAVLQLTLSVSKKSEFVRQNYNKKTRSTMTANSTENTQSSSNSSNQTTTTGAVLSKAAPVTAENTRGES
jgi:hypothetical protein